jgi:hypothetical protein
MRRRGGEDGGEDKRKSRENGGRRIESTFGSFGQLIGW